MNDFEQESCPLTSFRRLVARLPIWASVESALTSFGALLMARPASQVAEAFASRSAGLDSYIGRVEQQFQAGALRKADVHRAYAGAFVYFYLHLETAIEDLFM